MAKHFRYASPNNCANARASASFMMPFGCLRNSAGFPSQWWQHLRRSPEVGAVVVRVESPTEGIAMLVRKNWILWSFLLGSSASSAVPTAGAQEVQLHYDLRHTVDPETNPGNFPSVTFKGFKALAFGSFLLKMEGDFDGTRHNLSKVYFEMSQTLRFWTPSIYIHLEYTGGLGVFDGGTGGTGGYDIENA